LTNNKPWLESCVAVPPELPPPFALLAVFLGYDIGSNGITAPLRIFKGRAVAQAVFLLFGL
jgi:hypothetical protein